MTSIDQEIHCETPGGPISTRNTVTIDFSTDWRAKDSPWSPPEGMPLSVAIRTLLQGLGPRPRASRSTSPSPSRNPSRNPSRTPSRSPTRSLSLSPSRSHSPGPESTVCSPTSRSPSPVICDACLEHQVIASPSDCDCPKQAPIVSRCVTFISIY